MEKGDQSDSFTRLPIESFLNCLYREESKFKRELAYFQRCYALIFCLSYSHIQFPMSISMIIDPSFIVVCLYFELAITSRCNFVMACVNCYIIMHLYCTFKLVSLMLLIWVIRFITYTQRGQVRQGQEPCDILSLSYLPI